MRKMTKKAVTLAAMSAMTAASASLAFAAEKQDPNLSSIEKKEEAVTSSGVGEWSGDDVKGWSFTKEGDIKLKDTWAQIDGVWYYFKGDKIVQNRFLTLDDKGYFFDESGRLATGWQKITSKMDAYSDIDIADELYDPTNNYYVQVDDNHEYDYHDYVWCYFDNSGVAKHNEWFQDSTGLWYYFDGDVMVKNVYNYIVNPDNYDVADSSRKTLYGFDENGAMLVGWNYKEVETTWNDPTADEEGKIWYYYKSNGQMQQQGWKQIDGKWYLFADEDADYRSYRQNAIDGVGSRDDDKWRIGGFPLIVNSYVASYNNSKYEYFYVNKKGEMVTGVQTIPKKAYKVLFYQENKGVKVAYEQFKTEDAEIKVNFGKNGAAKEEVVDNSYYVLDTSNTTAAKFGSNINSNVWKVNNNLYNAAYVFDGWTLTGDAWRFTDEGAYVPNSNTVSVTGYITYKNVLGTSIKIPDTTAAAQAVADAEAAQRKYRAAVADEGTKLSAWEGYYNAVTVAVSGNYAASYQDDYTVLSARAAMTTAEATEVLRKVAYEAAYKINPSSATTANAYNLYIAAKEEAAIRTEIYEYVLAEAQMRALVNADDRDLAAKAYNNWQKAIKVTEEMLENVTAAEKAVYLLNYDYEVNKWDNGTLTDSTDFAVVGEIVKNAFISKKSGDAYLIDGDGNFVTNKAVVINTDANISYNNSTYQNAYILFGSNGKAVCGYEGTRKSITIGGVTYWATDRKISIGKTSNVTVFVSNKMVDTKDTGRVQH